MTVFNTNLYFHRRLTVKATDTVFYTYWPFGSLGDLAKRHPPCYILGVSTLGSTKGFPKVVTPGLSLGEWAQQVTKKQQQLSQESS